MLVQDFPDAIAIRTNMKPCSVRFPVPLSTIYDRFAPRQVFRKSGKEQFSGSKYLLFLLSFPFLRNRYEIPKPQLITWFRASTRFYIGVTLIISKHGIVNFPSRSDTFYLVPIPWKTNLVTWLDERDDEEPGTCLPG